MIRTPDPLVPGQVLCQTELHTDGRTGGSRTLRQKGLSFLGLPVASQSCGRRRETRTHRHQFLRLVGIPVPFNLRSGGDRENRTLLTGYAKPCRRPWYMRPHWSGRVESNHRPPVYQTEAPSTELLPESNRGGMRPASYTRPLGHHRLLACSLSRRSSSPVVL